MYIYFVVFMTPTMAVAARRRHGIIIINNVKLYCPVAMTRNDTIATAVENFRNHSKS